MNDVLIVVDLQNDFITGSLGTEEAPKILQHVIERIKGHMGTVLYTQDTHQDDYLKTQEGHHLPVPHCVKDTEGWALHPDIARALEEKGAIGIEKDTFGAKDLIQTLERCAADKPLTSITLMGLCTDICVISNALLIKAWFPEVPIYVDAAGSAGVTPESHDNALKAMEACQIQVINV